MKCAPVDQLVRAELEELSVVDLHRLQQHERGCERCRTERRHIRELLDDVEAVDDGGVPGVTFVANVLARCSRETVAPKERSQQPRWRGVASAFALAAVLAIGWFTGVAMKRNESWTARGTASSEPKLHARILVVRGDTFRPVETTTLEPGDGLAVRYWNATLDTQYLAAFALDAKGTVHWIYPRYVDATSDPQSIPIVPNAQGRMLDEVVEPDDPAEGAMKVTVLITERPVSVKTIEGRASAGRLGTFDDLKPLSVQTWSSAWHAR